MSLLLASLLVAANPTVAAAAEPATKAAKVSTRKICRVDPAYTGSRMAKKLCLTETEWAQRESGKTAGDLKTIGAR